jgi:predicted nucleic acid-binding protein
MSRVIDPSVAVKWYLVDELSAEADRVLGLVESVGAIVPALFRWEVQNVLRQAHSSGRIDEQGLEDAVVSLRALPIEVEDPGSRLLFGNELGLANAHDITVYDAAYLALAMDRRIPLATADNQLAHAARECGVTVELI